jgi:hypothetical protein
MLPLGMVRELLDAALEWRWSVLSVTSLVRPAPYPPPDEMC